LSTADRILAIDSKDIDALRCKLVALVKQSAFSQALAFIDTTPILR
jgi:hypothetical protein